MLQSLRERVAFGFDPRSEGGRGPEVLPSLAVIAKNEDYTVCTSIGVNPREEIRRYLARPSTLSAASF
jgi:hypothetical protein